MCAQASDSRSNPHQKELIILKNSVESVWSLLKRSVLGTHHRISIKYLDAYLDELEHRFNNRKNKYLFRDTLLKLVSAEKLPYRELVKAA
jgi:hypothetical protein